MMLSNGQLGPIWEGRLIEHSGGLFLDHLIGVYRILGAWRAPPDVRLAGLFHSAYSTEYFRYALVPAERRGAVAAAIGANAERLAHLFCLASRPMLHQLGGASYAADWSGILECRGGDVERVSAFDVDALLMLEAANLAEQCADEKGAPEPWMSEVISWSRCWRWTKLPAEGHGFSPGRTESAFIDLYTQATSNPDSALARQLLRPLTSASSPAGEPLIAAAVLALEHGDFLSATALAVSGAELLSVWGVAWDKRLALAEWLNLANALTAVSLRDLSEPGLGWAIFVDRLCR